MLGKTVSAMEDLQPESLRELGLDHVVLRFQNETEIEEAIERCTENGIRIAAIESNIGSEFDKVLELAKKANAIVLVKRIGDLPEQKMDKIEFEAYLVEMLHKLQTRAKEMGVPVGIMVTNRYESQAPYTVRDMGMLLYREGCLDLGLAVDTFDMNVEESSMEGALADWGQYICHIYLRDNHGGLPGTGIIDFVKLKNVFKTACSQVPMTIEDDEEEALRAAISYLKGGLLND